MKKYRFKCAYTRAQPQLPTQFRNVTATTSRKNLNIPQPNSTREDENGDFKDAKASDSFSLVTFSFGKEKVTVTNVGRCPSFL